MENREIELAQRIWDYMNIGEKNPHRSDLIFVLGSIDLLPAERGAELFLKGKGNYMLFSGKGGRNNERLPQWKEGLTEARMLADVAIKKGVPKSFILIEEESTNTGQNIQYSSKLLSSKGINLDDMIVVHMPSSLRRDYLTLRKQWPEPQPGIVMASPDIPFEEYHLRGYQGTMKRRDLVCDMLGDLQRIEVNAGKYNMPEEIPTKIKNAYYELVDRGYTAQLVKDKDSGLVIEI